jgi:hypothetical protein
MFVLIRQMLLSSFVGWTELDYHIDIYRVTKGSNIELL